MDLRFPENFRRRETLNWEAIALSLKLAVCVAGILLAVGLPIAYWVTFSRWRWKFLVEAIVALPLVLPPTVLGYYILVGLGPRHFAGRMWQSMVRPHAAVHVRRFAGRVRALQPAVRGAADFRGV